MYSYSPYDERIGQKYCSLSLSLSLSDTHRHTNTHTHTHIHTLYLTLSLSLTALMTKDLTLAVEAGSAKNVTLDLGSAALKMYSTLSSEGLAHKDFSVVYDYLKNKDQK